MSNRRSRKPSSPSAPRAGGGDREAAAARAAQQLLSGPADRKRLAGALHGLADELALERKRSATLRSELNRVRRRLAAAERKVD